MVKTYSPKENVRTLRKVARRRTYTLAVDNAQTYVFKGGLTSLQQLTSRCTQRCLRWRNRYTFLFHSSYIPPGTTNSCVSAVDIMMLMVYKDILHVGICIPSYSNLPVTWHDRPMTRNAAPASLCTLVHLRRRRKPAITHDHCTLLHPLKFISI